MLLGLAFALWRMTRDIDAVEAADPHPRATVEPAHGDAQEEAAPVATRDAKIAPATVARPAPRHPTTPGGPAVELPPPPEAKPVDSLPPVKRDIKNQLKKQVDAIDGFVSDCVARSAKAGVKPTGAAALTLRFEHVKQKVMVVDVAIEPIDTTVKDQPLLECLRDTGKKMQLDLVDEVTAVTATHQVDLDGGGIVDHRLTAFDVKQVGDPPPAP